MSTALRERPASLGTGNGGVPARRAVIRWGWRLFRREWRQQLLVLTLLAVAVGVTIFAAAVGTNAPSSPNAATFGTAQHLVTLPGRDPHLSSDLAAIEKYFSPVDVIENMRLSTGSVDTIDLRAQDPDGPYGKPTLALVSGRYPTGANQVALTSQVASLYNLKIGDTWHHAGQDWHIVGMVENPSNLLDEFALVAPGQVEHPGQVTILFDASQKKLSAYHFPPGVTPGTPAPPSLGLNPAIIVLALSTFGLIFIGLVAVAGFTVMAQRRLRSLGMLSSIGATDRNVRLVMIANGAAVGIVATVVGAVVGFAAWFVYAPHLQQSTAHVIDPFHLPWWAVITGMALAIVTAIVAAERPARAVARMPVVAALAERPAPPKPAARSALPGAVLLVAGFVLLTLSGKDNANGGRAEAELVGGTLVVTIGLILLGPLCITGLAAIGRRTPIAMRLALSDLARYRARSGAALGAVSFAVFLAVVICIQATARYANPVDYFGPNLPSNQLILYSHYGAWDAGFAGSAPKPPPAPDPAQLRSLKSALRNIASSLHTSNELELTTAQNPKAGGAGVYIQQPVASGKGVIQANTLYVATPAVLQHYGVSSASIKSSADVLTSRQGLDTVSNLQLYYGTPPSPDSSNQGACPAGTCISRPSVQTVSQLPTFTSDPNLLISQQAMQRLGLKPVVNGWLIQTAKPLTPAQINTARQLAGAVGGLIETKNQSPSLSEVRNLSTAIGILIALGVLAMTVGLIRSETTRDLRTLTAAGAAGTTRRALTSTTAGAIGLLGAVLGTGVAYLASIAWYRTKLSTTVSHVPVVDLIVILVGLPLAATVGGWLLAGREPRGIARQALE